jgi:hypothetical protein
MSFPGGFNPGKELEYPLNLRTHSISNYSTECFFYILLHKMDKDDPQSMYLYIASENNTN